MTIWAQIRKGKCRFVVEQDDPPIGKDWVDITDWAVKPSPGQWLWRDGTWRDEPPPPRVLTRFEFISRFTAAEKAAIMQAMKDNDLDVSIFYEMVKLAEKVDLDNPATAQGLDLLVAKGILTEERKGEILQ